MASSHIAHLRACRRIRDQIERASSTYREQSCDTNTADIG